MHNVFIIPVAVASTPHAPSSSFLSSRTLCSGSKIPLWVVEGEWRHGVCYLDL